MYSRSDDYRRRGIEAQNRAAAAADTTIRSAFDELARGWFALAEQTDLLDKCYRDRQPPQSAATSRRSPWLGLLP
jgi:hypothetical protein